MNRHDPTLRPTAQAMLVAASTFIVCACSEDSPTEATPPSDSTSTQATDALGNRIPILATPAVAERDGSDPLRATVAWPLEKELPDHALWAFADPLVREAPSWGTYVGIGQTTITTEGDPSPRMEATLDLQLAGRESIPALRSWIAAAPIAEPVIFIYLRSDQMSGVSSLDPDPRFIPYESGDP